MDQITQLVRDYQTAEQILVCISTERAVISGRIFIMYYLSMAYAGFKYLCVCIYI